MRTFSRSAEKSATVPTVHITKSKSRIKRYNSNSPKPIYYLKNGEEFQLELFNPTHDVVKAEIWLNNKLTSVAGLVLNPGERVFLDRYLDSVEKYKFVTYEVGNSSEVERAIQNNGEVDVRFYKEQIYNTVTTTWGTGHVWGAPTTTTFGGVSLPTYTDNSVFYSSTNTAFLANDNVTLDIMNSPQLLCDSNTRSVSNANKKETGRVEKGTRSNQELTYVDKTFESFPFYSVSYKLLPLSQKNVQSSDFRVAIYCTNCGAKLKKTHKFCPQCGTKK